MTQKENNTNIQEGIENQYLVVEENISKTSDEDDKNILLEEMDNADSNSEGDLEQETEVILTQKDINTFMNKEHRTENHYQENISEVSDEDDERISQEDMENADFNSVTDFDQEIDEISTSRKIVQGEKSFVDERFEEDVHQNEDFKDMNGSVIRIHECVECKKSFSRAENLRNHIHTVHEGKKNYKCKTCDKSFSRAQILKKHIHTVHEGHKDYKCNYCGKSFFTATHLKRHVHNIHEGHQLAN